MTRDEQAKLTPRDHLAIRAADPDYPPDPVPSTDPKFADEAAAKRKAYEAKRAAFAEQHGLVDPSTGIRTFKIKK